MLLAHVWLCDTAAPRKALGNGNLNVQNFDFELSFLRNQSAIAMARQTLQLTVRYACRPRLCFSGDRMISRLRMMFM